MKNLFKLTMVMFVAAATMFVTSCTKDESNENQVDTPNQYTWEYAVSQYPMLAEYPSFDNAFDKITHMDNSDREIVNIVVNNSPNETFSTYMDKVKQSGIFIVRNSSDEDGADFVAMHAESSGRLVITAQWYKSGKLSIRYKTMKNW